MAKKKKIVKKEIKKNEEEKSWWSRLKYWQRGGIIGFIYPFILYIIDLVFGLKGGLFFVIIYPILKLFLSPIKFLLYKINLISFDKAFLGGDLGLMYWGIALIISPIFYALVGALIGFIIGKIKVKSSRKK